MPSFPIGRTECEGTEEAMPVVRREEARKGKKRLEVGKIRTEESPAHTLERRGGVFCVWLV
jgi:hypothetical protein